MSATAKKREDREPPKKRPAKTRGQRPPASDVVVELVDARIQRALSRAVFDPMTIDKLARLVDERTAELRAAEAGEPTHENIAAREALYGAMLEHGPAPSDADVAAAFGKWR